MLGLLIEAALEFSAQDGVLGAAAVLLFGALLQRLNRSRAVGGLSVSTPAMRRGYRAGTVSLFCGAFALAASLIFLTHGSFGLWSVFAVSMITGMIVAYTLARWSGPAC